MVMSLLLCVLISNRILNRLEFKIRSFGRYSLSVCQGLVFCKSLCKEVKFNKSQSVNYKFKFQTEAI